MDTEPADQTRVRALLLGMHDVLLHLAGRVPDEVLAELRRELAGGELLYLADAVTAELATRQLGMPAADATALAAFQRAFAGGPAPALLDQIPVTPSVPATGHHFLASAAPATTATGGALPDALPDVPDYAAVTTVASRPGAVALWRAWRSDPNVSGADRQRVYVVEVAPAAEPWTLTGDLQRSLAAAGSVPPRVEVVTAGGEPPPYQRAARDGGEPLWRHGDPAPAGPRARPLPGRELAERAVTAAHAGDLDELRRLIDWPLTGAPRLARGLAELEPEQRAEAAAQSLVMFTVAGDDPDLVDRPLRQLAALLRGAERVELPDPSEQRAWLRMVQVPEVPAAGLTIDQLEQLAALRRRAAAVTEVFLAAGAEAVPLAWARDTHRLVAVFE